MAGGARRWVGAMVVALAAVPLTVTHPGVVFAAVTTPAVTSIAPVTGSTAGGNRVTVRGARFTRVQRILFGSVAGRSVTVRSSSVLEVTAPAQAAGRVDLRVVTVTGTSPVVAADRYTYIAPPGVSRLSATSGPLTGGARITITGVRLTGVTRVMFGATAGRSVTVISSTSLTVTVPAHAAGAVDVRVVNAYGTSPIVAAGRYTYVGAPTVTAVAPTSGGTAGGTRVTVRGTNFSGAVRVQFGTLAGISPTVTSTSALTVTAPAHAAGAVDVRVVTAYGTSPVSSADRFAYVAAPVLTGVSPASGSTAGGTRVTIRGAGLAATSQVTFGGAPATALTAAADSVTVTTPAHDAGPVAVQVVTPYGIATAQYSYVAPTPLRPTISALSPASGSTAGGTLVTVTGTNFSDGATVSFGGTSGTSVVVESSTRLTVVAPAHPAGNVDVTVTGPGGASIAATFSYAEPVCEPAVRHVSGAVSGAWSPQCVTEYVIDGTATVAAGAALAVAPGTVVRGGDLRVGGTLTAEGAELTGVDLAVLDNASLTLDRSTLSGGMGTEGTAALIRLTGSTLSGPGSITVGPCADGEVTGNHFAGAALFLSRCSVPVRGNQFDHTAGPLTLSEVDDLAAVGFMDNTFTGAGEQLRIDLIGGRVRPGTTVTVGPGVVLHPTRVKVEGTVLLQPGAIVKSDAVIQDQKGAFSVEAGGLMKIAGTAASPVTVTAYRDDSVDGDTNGDGSDTNPTLGTWASGFVSLNGGSLQADHADMRWLVFPISFYEPAAELSIHNSRFSTPAPINASGLPIDTGGIGGNGCTSGEISGNTFAGTYLNMTGCSIPIHDNTFVNTHRPMSLGHDNLAQVSFAGPTANTFAGTGDQLTVDLNGGGVRANTELVVDSASGAVLHPNRVAVAGTVTFLAGSIVKSDAPIQDRAGAFAVGAGGLVRLAGTPTAPVIVTAYRDDTVGGDSNGDGSLTDPTLGTWASGFVTLNGGSLQADHADMRWLVFPVIFEYEPAADLSIHNSRFSTPAPINASGLTIDAGDIGGNGCTSGEISGNTFAGTYLGMNGCSIPIHDNTFVNTHHPMSLGHDNLAQVPFSGPTANTFTGTGDQLRVDLNGGRIRSGTTVTVDALTGAVLHPNHLSVQGTLLLNPGVIVKSDAAIQDRGGAVTVPAGGKVTMFGTGAAPVTVTAYNDDSVGGDTNGDGFTTQPTTGIWASGFATLNGGSLDAQYATFNWLVYPIISEYETAGTVTVRGSTFQTPSAINASGLRIETAVVFLRGCTGGEFSSNTFEGTSLVLGDCPLPVYSNRFVRTPNPLAMAGDDIAKLDLAGDYTNTFTGTGVQRRVDLSAAHIANGTTLEVDGADSHAVLDLATPITSSHAIGVRTGSVLLTDGAVVKGRGPLFDLGPESSFSVTGSTTAPVVFAPADDDGVAGDTNGDGATGIRNNLSEIFKSDQSATWATVPLSAVGVDLRQTGPGWATIAHAVIRHADTAFTGCLVCELTVNDTDFMDVRLGVSQAYYQMPLAPCLPLMGRALLDGGNPVWQRADAKDNYWGGAGGPTSDINWVEVATSFAGQKEQYDRLVAGLPLEQAGPVRTAFENMAAQWGDKIPNFNLTDHAAAGASLQSCTIPVINVTFPLLVIPEDFSNWSNTPRNDQSRLSHL